MLSKHWYQLQIALLLKRNQITMTFRFFAFLKIEIELFLHLNVYKQKMVGWLVGYLMQNPFLYK